MSDVYDLAVIGSGFAGSLLAVIARKLGKSVLLLERGRHPRFAIGESSTPLANLLLEELSIRYDLPAITPLCKWGPWQRTYPQLGCGLKRGFTFYHHRLGQPSDAISNREDQLLVAASPHDEISDTHWYRADVDAFFVQQARDAGVTYLDEVQLQSASDQGDFMRLEGPSTSFSARFVVDATGPRGFLHRALSLPEAVLPEFPETEALYTHFRNVRRVDELKASQGAPPYPVDDAALHHVFDGGWIWVLRFNNGITSAGLAADHSLARRLRLDEGAPAWNRLMELLPAVRDQFENAVPERPFTYAPRLSFRSGVMAGRRWAMLPSAAGFVDPLMSTGFPLVLFGVGRLAEILETGCAPEPLAQYAKQTDDDLLATARLIGSLYSTMGDFPSFVSVSMLYFAAASYAEAGRRLGRSHLAGSFLLRDNPEFNRPAEALLQRARGHANKELLHDDIVRAIEPFNIAGLGKRDRRNWYPVEAEDFLAGASKLGADRGQVQRLLDHSSFFLSERLSNSWPPGCERFFDSKTSVTI